VDSLEFSTSGCEVVMHKKLSSSSIRGGIS